MKHRFHVPDALKTGTTVSLDGEERHHARVLRVREGEEIELFDARGKNFLARFDGDTIQVLSETENREPKAENHLAISIIQPDKFEFVLQKATELGVRSFIPLITDRMEVRIERIRGKEDRWRKIVMEAVKQSGRSHVPAIEPAAKFEDAITRPATKIVFDLDASPTTDNRQPTTVLFIGPEGGFSERELQLARENGASFERLGPRRLRAETAAVVALAVVAARSGDI